MKLPTNEEIDAAALLFDLEGPQPVAGIIDGSPMFSKWVRGITAAVRGGAAPLDQAIKAGLVLGLNLGIRIGESRAPARVQ